MCACSRDPGATQAQKDEVQRLLGELEKNGGEFRSLTDLTDMFRQNYDRLLTELEKARNDMTKELTYTNIVVYPEVSDKKVYPIRWLIVLISTAATVFLAFVLLAWMDSPAPRTSHR
jgi:capsule polysaccharide export protein KpsE/RkpR